MQTKILDFFTILSQWFIFLYIYNYNIKLINYKIECAIIYKIYKVNIF